MPKSDTMTIPKKVPAKHQYLEIHFLLPLRLLLNELRLLLPPKLALDASPAAWEGSLMLPEMREEEEKLACCRNKRLSLVKS
jgi:hypothetical protein